MISEKDGIHIELKTGTLVADGRSSKGDHNFVSHAHFDHMHLNNENKIICSENTKKLVETRTSETFQVQRPKKFKLINSGHVLGSSAIKTRAKNNKKVLYTGDISLKDRAFVKGFETVKTDILVLETTYGIQSYVFPEPGDVEKQIVDWIKDNNDKPLFLFAYSLGKAQKIQYLIEKYTEREVLLHEAAKKVSETYNELLEHDFTNKPYKDNKSSLKDGNAVYIGPTRTSKSDWLNKLVDKTNGLKAGFSGWAVNNSYSYRGGYDKTFVYSDHCDFNDLVKIVEETSPEKVYTFHGFDEAFAGYLKREMGVNARALKQNQSSIDDFY